MSHAWKSGDAVALRYLPMGRVRWVKPVRVAEDSPSTIALFLAANTVIKKPIDPKDGSPIGRALSYKERFAVDWRLGDGTWEDNSVLMLTRPGQAHSFWAFWRAQDWTFLGWYVNFQEPLRRTPVGFDTADHVLDLVVDPSLATWRWKDEDEFEEACEVGRFTSEQADRIRGEAEAVLAIVRSRGWPLDSAWVEWRPDPDWTLPTLPSGWDTLP
jgi:Protein of unknown function (DUF402)